MRIYGELEKCTSDPKAKVSIWHGAKEPNMKNSVIITSVAAGIRGDVNSLIELGEEMIRRGHEFRILTSVQKISQKIRKQNGVVTAADGIENYVSEITNE